MVSLKINISTAAKAPSPVIRLRGDLLINMEMMTMMATHEKITWIYFFIALLFSVNAVLNSVGNVLMNKEDVYKRQPLNWNGLMTMV